MEQLRSRREVLYAVVVPEAPTKDICTDGCCYLHDRWMYISKMHVCACYLQHKLAISRAVTWHVDLSVSAQQRG